MVNISGQQGWDFHCDVACMWFFFPLQNFLETLMRQRRNLRQWFSNFSQQHNHLKALLTHGLCRASRVFWFSRSAEGLRFYISNKRLNDVTAGHPVATYWEALSLKIHFTVSLIFFSVFMKNVSYSTTVPMIYVRKYVLAWERILTTKKSKVIPLFVIWHFRKNL